MHVVFRVDASLLIGSGHVMRCLTLADELAYQGRKCWFICREHPGHLGDVIKSKGHSLTLLPSPTEPPQLHHQSACNAYARWLGVPWQVDANQTLEAISTLNPDWLVVDHYALDTEWECTLSNAVGKIMVIDDLANRAHKCKLLLDQNLGRVTTDYEELLPTECKRLIGPRYALLRREFASLREQSLSRRKASELKRILISLGGVDRTNATGQLLTALTHSSLPASTELDIVMGGAAPYLDQVRQQATQLPFKATVSVNVQDMAERMCLADLSIGAAGGTSWERACLGLPTVLIILTENQIPGAKALEAAGAAKIIGKPSLVKKKLPKILSELSKSSLLLHMSKAAADITDGQGALGVISNIGITER